MGKQFYHFDPYSRVESNSKMKSGKSIYSVANEAERVKGYCEHVENPKMPDLLFGVPFSDVVKMAERYAENTIDSCGRAVRKNGFCAIFGVISAPHDMNEKIWREYKKDCIQYLKDYWGSNLKSIIEHTDEYFESDIEKNIKSGILHRHIHFGVVNETGVNFSYIHPGIKAKRAADKAYGISKKPNEMNDEEFVIFKKKGRKAGDNAYRNAMKVVQDDFFTKVSDKFGLLRYGPKRLRLTRDEIKKRNHEKRLKQKEIVKLAEQEEKIKEQSIEIEKSRIELENTRLEKEKIDEYNKEQKEELSIRKKEIKEREIAVYSKEQFKNDFEKGVNRFLKGWQMPKPKIGEFAAHYIRRVSGEVLGVIARAIATRNSFNQKKIELDKKQEQFEAEKNEIMRKETIKLEMVTKTFNSNLQKIKFSYENLKNKVMKAKNIQDVLALQKELSTKNSSLKI